MERYIKFKEQCKDCTHHTECVARDTCKSCTNLISVFKCYCALPADRGKNECPRYEKFAQGKLEQKKFRKLKGVKL